MEIHREILPANRKLWHKAHLAKAVGMTNHNAARFHMDAPN
jgi:hypothetical protein